MKITKILMSHPESDCYFLLDTQKEVEKCINSDGNCHELGEIEIEFSIKEAIKLMVEFKRLSITNKLSVIETIKEGINKAESIDGFNGLKDLGSVIKDYNFDDITNQTLRDLWKSRYTELKRIESIRTTGKCNGRSI